MRLHCPTWYALADRSHGYSPESLDVAMPRPLTLHFRSSEDLTERIRRLEDECRRLATMNGSQAAFVLSMPQEDLSAYHPPLPIPVECKPPALKPPVLPPESRLVPLPPVKADGSSTPRTRKPPAMPELSLTGDPKRDLMTAILRMHPTCTVACEPAGHLGRAFAFTPDGTLRIVKTGPTPERALYLVFLECWRSRSGRLLDPGMQAIMKRLEDLHADVSSIYGRATRPPRTRKPSTPSSENLSAINARLRAIGAPLLKTH